MTETPLFQKRDLKVVRIVFVFPDETLSVADFFPRPAYALFRYFGEVFLLESGVIAGTAGTGTNTILLQSTTTNPFSGSPSWTTRVTHALGTTKGVSTTDFSAWKWNPQTEYLKMSCSAGTTPKDVSGYLDVAYRSGVR